MVLRTAVLYTTLIFCTLTRLLISLQYLYSNHVQMLLFLLKLYIDV